MNKKHTESKSTFYTAIPKAHIEPIIEILGNNEAIIEGCYGIVEYSDIMISVNCRLFVVKFEGFDLTIKSLSKNSISVNGKISAINYILM